MIDRGDPPRALRSRRAVEIDEDQHPLRSSAYTWRIDRLRETSAAIKFLSLEPLLGPLADLDLRGIDWAIVGGESGPGARPMEAEWVREIRQQCADARVAFFFKQWGGIQKKRAGRVLDGRTYDEMPSPERATDERRRRVALPRRTCCSFRSAPLAKWTKSPWRSSPFER